MWPCDKLYDIQGLPQVPLALTPLDLLKEIHDWALAADTALTVGGAAFVIGKVVPGVLGCVAFKISGAAFDVAKAKLSDAYVLLNNNGHKDPNKWSLALSALESLHEGV